MKNQQEAIELEMRLNALEYMVCKLYVSQVAHSGISEDQITAAYRDFLDGARRQMFPGLDPAMSDLASAEWERAIERLLTAQKEMLAQRTEKKGHG